jgi:hypothetical protein
MKRLLIILAALCIPAHASQKPNILLILAGHYPHQAGVGHMLGKTQFPAASDGLNPKLPTPAKSHPSSTRIPRKSITSPPPNQASPMNSKNNGPPGPIASVSSLGPSQSNRANLSKKTITDRLEP